MIIVILQNVKFEHKLYSKVAKRVVGVKKFIVKRIGKCQKMLCYLFWNYFYFPDQLWPQI